MHRWKAPVEAVQSLPSLIHTVEHTTSRVSRSEHLDLEKTKVSRQAG